MAKTYTYSYDMYLITTDRTQSDRPPLNTFPLGVGYIESENKRITDDDIYGNMLKNGFNHLKKDPRVAFYDKPEIVAHPCTDICRSYKEYIPYADMQLHAIRIYNDLYIVVNNIRRIY